MGGEVWGMSHLYDALKKLEADRSRKAVEESVGLGERLVTMVPVAGIPPAAEPRPGESHRYLSGLTGAVLVFVGLTGAWAALRWGIARPAMETSARAAVEAVPAENVPVAPPVVPPASPAQDEQPAMATPGPSAEA